MNIFKASLGELIQPATFVAFGTLIFGSTLFRILHGTP